MDRLKIIIVHSGDLDINTGGGVHTLELLKNLSKKHDVTCLVSNSNISDLYPQIKTIPRLKMRGLKSLSYDFFVGLFILHQFIKNKPDIIYARKPGYGLFPAILSKIIRATYIIELNGLKRNDAQALDPQINNYYLAAMDIVEKINYVLAYNIIAVTRELKLALINKYGL